jgi:hypothetical protein
LKERAAKYASSALPGGAASSFQKLKSVRKIFETFPGEKSCGGSYIKFTMLLLVELLLVA